MPSGEWSRRNPEKVKATRKRWYDSNKGKVKEKTAARARRIAAWILEYKSSLSCEKCGESHVAAIDFHHRDPSEKVTEITDCPSRGWGIKRILTEISKCAVLCANCHRKLHWEEKNVPRV